ncbi:MAG: hypothetical protein ACJ76N_06830, partial [Thermoanaerobaculia bacterium]
KPRWADAVIALALTAAAWLLYDPILRLWWTYDDFYHFRHLMLPRFRRNSPLGSRSLSKRKVFVFAG